MLIPSSVLAQSVISTLGNKIGSACGELPIICSNSTSICCSSVGQSFAYTAIIAIDTEGTLGVAEGDVIIVLVAGPNRTCGYHE